MLEVLLFNILIASSFRKNLILRYVYSVVPYDFEMCFLCINPKDPSFHDMDKVICSVLFQYHIRLE